jgi:hypothetical protein
VQGARGPAAGLVFIKQWNDDCKKERDIRSCTDDPETTGEFKETADGDDLDNGCAFSLN